jgi:hypothetical protein
MQELLNALPVLSGVVDKAGVVGILLGGCIFLGWQLDKRRKELIKTYRERDKARMIQNRYKTVLDQRGIDVNVSDIIEMFADTTEV